MKEAEKKLFSNFMHNFRARLGVLFFHDLGHMMGYPPPPPLDYKLGSCKFLGLAFSITEACRFATFFIFIFFSRAMTSSLCHHMPSHVITCHHIMMQIIT